MLRGAILGHVIGDVLGVPVETCPRCYLKDKPVIEPERLGQFGKLGLYSDDTSMVLATMQSIINNKGNINYNDIMLQFYLWLASGKFSAEGKAYGIGGTTQKAINRFAMGCNPIECGETNINANGNGALMRLLPIILYLHKKNASEEEIIETIKNITTMTHAHEINIMGTYIFTKFYMNILNGDTVRESYDKIRKLDYSRFSRKTINRYHKVLKCDLGKLKERKVKSGMTIWETIEAVIWTLLHTKGFKDAVLTAVNLGGDTDTIGAITGSIAGLLYEDEIPKEWLTKVMGINKIENTIKQFERIIE